MVENLCIEKVEIRIVLRMNFDQNIKFQSSYPLILQVNKDCVCEVGRYRGNYSSVEQEHIQGSIKHNTFKLHIYE